MRVTFVLSVGAIGAVALGGYLTCQRLMNTERNHRPGVAALDERDLESLPEGLRERRRALARQFVNEAAEKLAFQSLESRLPKGKPIPLQQQLSLAAKERWSTFDDDIAGRQEARVWLLASFHRESVESFVNSPGVGSGRVSPLETLLGETAPVSPPKQFGPAADFPVSTGEAVDPVAPASDHYWIHKSEMLDFFRPGSFGYVKSPRQVAGFQEHGFRLHQHGYRAGLESWQVQHIQLVGVLMSERPVVYLTDKVPSMAQVRAGTTRELDFFEEAGLAAIRGGEDLYIIRKDSTLRMLGALRATQTCLKCHDAQRGDLLGAFSYTLRPLP